MRKTFIIIVILEALFLGREWGGQTLARYTDKQHDEIIREYNKLANKYKDLNGRNIVLEKWLSLFLKEKHDLYFNQRSK